MKFYVYELIGADGEVLYIGKGTGYRLNHQRRAYGLQGHEVARFKLEKDAYAYEAARIAEQQPPLNRARGGGGSKYGSYREPSWIQEMHRMGTRRYAAQFLLRRATHLMEPSIVEALRAVADGARA